MVATWITWLSNVTATSKKFSPRTVFWFSLSLTSAAVYSLLALREAFSGEYVVQDDARQHVFWMLRFVEPASFPNDLIADYFQTVAPIGYKALYQAVAALGIHPLLFNKLLPLLLNLVTTSYCFACTMQLIPVPAAAFCSTLLLAQSLGLTDTVVSGTPKAFIYPLFLAFIYYLLKDSLLLCLGAIALLGLFYPSLVFIAVIVLLLRLVKWQGRLYLSTNRRDWLMCGAGLAVAVLVLLPYALTTHQFEPVIWAAQARQLPEFLPGGRSRFFYDDDLEKFWLRGRSGIRLDSALTPVTNTAGFLLLLLPQFPRYFPLVRSLRKLIILPQIIVASFVMFFAAHALLFKLHLPSRYTGHSLRIVMSIAAGIVFVILIDAVVTWSRQYAPFGWRSPLACASIAAIAIALLFYPSFVENFPITAYKAGEAPALYEFFQQQPPESLIASLAEESNNLPTFAGRSILVGSEYAIPYHWGYYRQIRKRTADLITAQYSPDPRVLKNFIQTYGIDFWLLDPSNLSSQALADNDWLRQYQPATEGAIAQLESGQQPALVHSIPDCKVFEDQGLVVLEAQCILETLNNFPTPYTLHPTPRLS